MYFLGTKRSTEKDKYVYTAKGAECKCSTFFPPGNYNTEPWDSYLIYLLLVPIFFVNLVLSKLVVARDSALII